MALAKKITYWVSTLWLSLGIAATGMVQLLHLQAPGQLSPPGVYGITHLGYPVYFLTIIGVWKILGVIALLIPRFPLLKEWAYAGCFFLMTGAVISHIALGDSFKDSFPAVILVILTVISWYTRPVSRKIILANQ